jgi:hypothetical protein
MKILYLTILLLNSGLPIEEGGYLHDEAKLEFIRWRINKLKDPNDLGIHADDKVMLQSKLLSWSKNLKCIRDYFKEKDISAYDSLTWLHKSYRPNSDFIREILGPNEIDTVYAQANFNNRDSILTPSFVKEINSRFKFKKRDGRVSYQVGNPIVVGDYVVTCEYVRGNLWSSEAITIFKREGPGRFSKQRVLQTRYIVS